LAYLTDRLSGSERAGFVAGILWALAPLPAVFSGILETEILFTFLFLLALLVLAGKGWWNGLVAGLLIGIGTLVRPIGILLIPGLLPAALATEKGLGRALRVATFLLGCGLALAPWLIRNESVFGSATISPVGGDNLLYYNASSCLAHLKGTDWEGGKRAAQQEYELYLERNSLQPESEAEKGDAAMKAAVAILLRHPIQCAWFNTVDSLNSLRPGASYTLMFLRPGLLPTEGPPGGELSPAMSNIADPLVLAVSATLTVFYALLYLLALGGLIWSLARKRFNVLWLILLPALLLLYAPGLAGNARFRIPVEPGLCLLAAVALCESLPAVFHRIRPSSTH
jgi:4-amino-4-deoxy-L-arabinose transferase-like glycosyltransferase